MLLAVIDIAIMLLRLAGFVIVVQVVLSWLVQFNVINTHNDFVRTLVTALDRMTRPLFRPIQRIMPDFGGIDFSPIVVLILIWVLIRLLTGVAVQVALSGY
jgi:YggT family protein